jgi:hypothetical protein
MAYDKTKLRLIPGGVPGENLYTYKTTDLLSVVVASGYFDDAVTDYNMATGDKIIASTGSVGAAAVDLLVATLTTATITVVNGS